MKSLPFTLEIKRGGREVWRVIGILTLGADGIGIEWRSDEYRRRSLRRSLRHVGRGEVHDAMIPWQYIDNVAYHGSFIGSGAIRVRARTMNALDVLPGADGPHWEVRVASPDRTRAREFVLAAESAVGATLQLLERRTRT